MSDYLTFETRVQPVEWGSATYTVIILPENVAKELTAKGAKRVEGEINDYPVNLGLSRAKEVCDGIFLWTGKSLLKAAGISPGEGIDIRLRRADETIIETPPEVLKAIMSAGRLDAWQALTPGK